jgi:hypothetical protein
MSDSGPHGEREIIAHTATGHGEFSRSANFALSTAPVTRRAPALVVVV